jgi:hypothetical protein
MPVMTFRTLMTANGTASPLSGSQYEFLPFDARVEIAMTSSVVSQVLATVYSGSDVLMEEGPVAFATLGQQPKYPDDFLLVDDALAGDRLKILLREFAAGTPTVMTVVRITPY